MSNYLCDTRIDPLVRVSLSAGNKRKLHTPHSLIRWQKLTKAVFLSEVEYWTNVSIAGNPDIGKPPNANGWFRRTAKDWESRIGLGDRQVGRIASQLEADGLIESSIQKVNETPKKHYRISTAFYEKFAEFLKSEAEQGGDKMSESESDKMSPPPRQNVRILESDKMSDSTIYRGSLEEERGTPEPLTQKAKSQKPADAHQETGLPKTKELEETGSQSEGRYSAAPWGASDCERVESRFNNSSLLPWRTGRGPNDWDESILEYWLKEKGPDHEVRTGRKAKRSDAVTWFVKASSDESRMVQAIALVEDMKSEIKKEESRLPSASAGDTAPYNPHNYPPPPTAEEKAEVNARFGRRSA